MIAGTTNKSMNISNLKINIDFSFIYFLVIKLQGLVAVSISLQLSNAETGITRTPKPTIYIPYIPQDNIQELLIT